jgi:protein O-mannosyl-transferase
MPATSPPVPSLRFTRIALGCLLFLVTLLLYWPVHTYGFITLDDGPFVEFNPHVNTGLNAANLWWAFTSAEIDYWRPLSWLSHMLDVEFYGLNAGGHHVTSIVIHALNAVLVFVFALLVLPRTSSAFLVAALFAWHPIHVESVAWIAERKDVLCGAFWLTALILYVRYAQTGRQKLLILTAVTFVGGIMCKPMIITLPFQLLLLDIWPLKRLQLPESWRQPAERRATWQALLRLTREKTVFFAITGVVCIWTFIAQKQANAMTISEHVSLFDRTSNSLVSYTRYLGKLVWPTDLAVFYPYPDAWPAATIAGAALLLLVITFVTIRQLRPRPFLFVGWAWFIGTLLPVIGIIQVGSQAMADRYTYTPAIGIYLALLSFVTLGKWRNPPAIQAVIATAVVLCAVQCRKQIRTWETGPTVFTHAIKVTHDNWLAMNNLANYHSREGRWDLALPLFAEVARLFPGNPESFYNLGLAQSETGQFAAAGANFHRVVTDNPNHPGAHHDLAILLAEKSGDHAAAIPLYRRALELQPELNSARFGLVNSLAAVGDRAGAMKLLTELTTADPQAVPAYISLAQLHSAAGDNRTGLAILENALQKNPDSGYLAYNAGSFAATLGEKKRANAYLDRARKIAEADRDAALYQAATELLQRPDR